MESGAKFSQRLNSGKPLNQHVMQHIHIFYLSAPVDERGREREKLCKTGDTLQFTTLWFISSVFELHCRLDSLQTDKQ